MDIPRLAGTAYVFQYFLDKELTPSFWRPWYGSTLLLVSMSRKSCASLYSRSSTGFGNQARILEQELNELVLLPDNRHRTRGRRKAYAGSFISR